MKKYISLEDISYKAGDKINVFFEGSGFITSASTSLRITIPINKSVSANSAVLTGYLTVRQGGNYIYGSPDENTDITSLTQKCQRICPNGISFAIEKSDKYTNAQNNDACGILFVGEMEFI